ncbi:threonine--tRNA ligase, partial [Candidatus Saccharibacteria bacterium]|nr:threonine--tRNA ligase [Candidatus Saccharibacteria bacterium]
MAEKETDVFKMRHTLSHVLAAAVLEMYPEAKLGIGPAIDDGFYYDIDFGGKSVTEADLPKIEKKMRGIIKRGFEMKTRELTRKEALDWAATAGQKYKVELIEELPAGEKITFYDMTLKDGKVLFEDLCKGPHVKKSAEIGAFRLTKVAGAYWRGDEKREMLTRIYGVAFETEKELDDYLAWQEEAKARDHRKLGQQLELYCSSPLVGSGLPLFTPRGTILRDMLNRFAQSYREDRGYQKVCIPHIALVDLYKTSGHYEKFPELLKFVS